jgi:hypothetical protein
MSFGKSQIYNMQPSSLDSIDPENPVDWEYSENPYGDSAKGILLAQ